ncbi:MAG: four helix bundle protein [Thermodesulfobacteriota bacterium]
MNNTFDHEKLKVYQTSIRFIAWLHKILKAVPKKQAVHDQLDRAATSIVLNIAEGNGKYSKKDRCRYFDIARGSALESAAALDILSAKDLIQKEEMKVGKEMLNEIVSMLAGLIKYHSDHRICEVVAGFGEEGEGDGEQE